MKRVDVLAIFSADKQPVATVELTKEDVATIMAGLSIAGGLMRQQGNRDEMFKDLFAAFRNELSDLWSWT